MFVIKWVNKYSNETGFVKMVRKSKGYFENTTDIAEARKFRTAKEADKVITELIGIGEGENNDFEAVEA